MSLQSCLRSECIRTGSSVRNKEEVLKEIASMAKESAILSAYDEDDLYNALAERESLGSTGFGNGIAIPHCSLENISDFVIGLLTVPGGADFDSVDNEKTVIFFFIIGPKKKRSQHIHYLSVISKIVNNRKARELLLSTNDEAAIKNFVLRLAQSEEEGISKQQEKCLFQVFIQKEKYFTDILQIFSSSVPGSIAVMEINSAGYYLNSLPLFAGLWHDDNREYNKVIQAVVDKTQSNDIIRRINMVVENIETEPGVLITVQELYYSCGSIEF
ncbi:MAG: PTS sugar transporter subunit IIA [Spirochaetota bacterium]